MRVFVRSRKVVGELLGFTLGPVPVTGMDEKRQLVQGVQMMPVGVVALESEFVYTPLHDLTPVWETPASEELTGPEQEDAVIATLEELDETDRGGWPTEATVTMAATRKVSQAGMTTFTV